MIFTTRRERIVIWILVVCALFFSLLRYFRVRESIALYQKGELIRRVQRFEGIDPGEEQREAGS